MACCGVAFPPYTFPSWVNSSFPEASRVVLRPFHIQRDTSWEVLGKIYIPLLTLLKAKGTVLHWLCQARDKPGKLPWSFHFNLKPINLFSSSVPSPKRGGIPVRRKGPSQCLVQVWTPRLWVRRSFAFDSLEPRGKTWVSSLWGQMLQGLWELWESLCDSLEAGMTVYSSSRPWVSLTSFPLENRRK